MKKISTILFIVGGVIIIIGAILMIVGLHTDLILSAKVGLGQVTTTNLGSISEDMKNTGLSFGEYKSQLKDVVDLYRQYDTGLTPYLTEFVDSAWSHMSEAVAGMWIIIIGIATFIGGLIAFFLKR